MGKKRRNKLSNKMRLIQDPNRRPPNEVQKTMDALHIRDDDHQELQKGIAIVDSSKQQPKKSNSEVQSKEIDASKGESSKDFSTKDFSELQIFDAELPLQCDGLVIDSCIGRTLLAVDLKYAEIALKSYEERQEAKFVILRVLFSNRAKLDVPGYDADSLWCHVSFIAEPRNTGCIDDPPKHFFGEMVFDRAEDKYNVTYCSIFEPTDPRNVAGCVFCPRMELFLHPVDGCPANGRQNDKMMAQKGVDASQGQTDGCSKLHSRGPNRIRNSHDAKIFTKAVKDLHLKYAKIALEFYEKSKDAEFGIDEVMFAVNKPIVRNVKEEWWCHIVFTAKPRNADCSEYFFGELLRESTTGKYDATYCEIFKPSDCRVTDGCSFCPPSKKHPFGGFLGGLPPHAIADFEVL